MEQVVGSIFQVIGLYLLAGFVFAIVFVIWGIGRVDPAAKNTSVAFRIIVLPGVSIFWPLLALRWLRGQGEVPVEKRNKHRKQAVSKEIV